MVLDIELIQLYRCETIDQLMQHTVSLCDSVGVPMLALMWAPAPGPDAVMVKNSAIIWDNYDGHIGANSTALKKELTGSVAVALTKDRANTKACQSWKLNRPDVFQVFAHAPADFFLSEYQRRLMNDFTAVEWNEFFATAVCRERDRTLFLTAKTQRGVTDQMTAAMQSLLSTFASAYRFLYIKSGSQPSDYAEGDDAMALSSREVECLQWLASGKTLGEAATILGISERTLRYHINNARERLGVATTVQAIVAAALAYGFDPHDARRSICASSRP